jgi:diguanylate cyclase (GGDEF)-like protein
MKGRAQVSSTISVDEDGEKVLSLAVPIFQKKQVVGVIVGTFSYSVLDNIFSVDTFRGSGYSFLVDKAGLILVGSKSSKRLCYEENWLDFLVHNNAITNEQLTYIKNHIATDRTEFLTYEVFGKGRVMIYTPVFLNDWYVLSVVPSEYIDRQQSGIVRITGIFFIVLGGAIIGFILIITNLIQHSQQIERDNVRYAASTESMQTIIFEYDFERKVIEFTGNTVFFFGRKVKSLPIEDFDEFERHVHESERGMINRIKDFIYSGESSYSSEFRVRGEGGKYIWFRITGSVILNNEKRPVKFIGNAVNVNDQVVHERELQEMAETDLLSGLLNKTFMEKYVSEHIANNDCLGAMYMIDLDNFKQVNDRIGHSAGDKAICDAAMKLKLVFSEKDYISRLGGDEFCVFMCLKSDITPERADELINEKAKILGSMLLDDYTSEDVKVHVTASIGISLYPQDGKTYKSLFECADSALYYVKENGKDGYELFDEKIMKKAGESIYGV